MNINASGVVIKTVAKEDRSKLGKLRVEAHDAMNAVMLLTPEEIASAGLNPDDVTELRSVIEEYRQAVMFLKAAERMSDKLRQTVLSHGHTIASLLGEISAQGRRRARVSPERGDILDALTPIINYQTAPAKKARLTRVRNEEAAAEQGAEEPTKEPAKAKAFEEDAPVSVAG
ncbi:hypothetical protein [Chondromyces apiculatus]|uniref:Uncharacterized protein n=1 Tax=Chondromyces apiculatus DSM 436 TaxID=1192034 RepID=A0A017SV04_9BACT|nr:hypothetical protein [Chondromyces apiculatus]EYF00111.1 Hypothetical protein CAP_1362 [Chondromyces apiculatus DSM 436]